MPEVKFKAFTGINNQAEDDALESSDFSIAKNVDVDDARRLRRRAGLSAPKISGNCHSMFAMRDALYYRTGTELRRADPVSFAHQLADTGLTGPTTYTAIGDKLMYSDGLVARTLFDGEGARQWGVKPPRFAPAMSASVGALPSGSYLCTMTYRTADGEESGAPSPARIDAAEGIAFTCEVSTDPAVTEKLVYLSTTGGEILYLAFVIPNAQTQATYGGDCADFGPALETLHKTPPPPSQVIGQWGGRVAVGTANFLLYSDQFRFERFDPIRQSIPFDSALTLFASITPSACVVGTKTSIWMLTGDDLASVSVVKLADYGAIPGTATEADTFADDGVQRAVYFATPKGLCKVTAAGLVNLTGGRYRKPAQKGSALCRTADGNHQVLFSLEGTS